MTLKMIFQMKLSAARAILSLLFLASCTIPPSSQIGKIFTPESDQVAPLQPPQPPQPPCPAGMYCPGPGQYYSPGTYCRWNRTGLPAPQQQICLDQDKVEDAEAIPIPNLPVDATFPASDPNMIAVTDVYAMDITEELLICGARSERWANIMTMAVNFNLTQAPEDQQVAFHRMTIKTGDVPQNLMAICKALVNHPVHADLIESMDALVIQANND